MKYYAPPQVTDYGSIAGITAVDQTVNETDTLILASGAEDSQQGPASQVACIDVVGPNGLPVPGGGVNGVGGDGICDFEQP